MSEVDNATTAPAPVLATASAQDTPQSPPGRTGKPAYKSWRKKYYKMRHRFHTLMNQNHKRFEEEQNTIKLARRLQEQNDQLLHILYESNHSKRLPPKLRYDINPALKTPSLSDVPNLVDDLEENESTSELPCEPSKSLAALESVPHSSLEDLPPDVKSIEEADRSIFDDHIGYLSPSHETEYLTAMDSFDSRSRVPIQEMSMPNGPWSSHDSAGAAMKNPVSVYNWLKKHQPNVFINDPDEKTAASGSAAKEEKASGRPAPTKVQPKRASVGAKHHAEEVLDDDGFVISGGGSEHAETGSIRMKRKQADDDAYRPKGGNSRKRKKLSASQAGVPNESDAHA